MARARRLLRHPAAGRLRSTAKSALRALGYEEFGVLEEFPPGMRRHFLRKAL